MPGMSGASHETRGQEPITCSCNRSQRALCLGTTEVAFAIPQEEAAAEGVGDQSSEIFRLGGSAAAGFIRDEGPLHGKES